MTKAYKILGLILMVPTLSFAQESSSSSTTSSSSSGGGGGDTVSASSAYESKPTSRRKEPMIALSMSYRGNKDIDDVRVLPASSIPDSPGFSPQPVNGTGNPKNVNSSMTLSQYKANIYLNWLSKRFITSTLAVGLPWRTVKSGNSLAPQGTEMGGYDVAMVTSLLNFELRFGYAQRNSRKLLLHDSHPEFFAGFQFENRMALPGRIGLSAYFGPEAALPQGKTLANYQIKYGPQFGFTAGMALETFFDRDARFKLAGDLFFRRTDKYSIGGAEQGGAGLMTVTPALDYLLLDQFWIGAYYELPVAQPKNREQRFGNTELPGLYGPSFGLRLRAASL